MLTRRLIKTPQNITVDATDQRINYRGSWVVQDNGGHEFSTTPGSGLTFSFNGTAIYYHATHNPNTAVMEAAVDDDDFTTFDGSIGTTVNSSTTPAILFQKEGLSPDVTHILNVSWVGPGSLGGPYGEIYTLVYTQDNVNDTLGVNGTLPSSSTSSHKSNTGAIVGGVLGGLAALAILAVAFLLLRRRRRRVPKVQNVNPNQNAPMRETSQHGVEPYAIPDSSHSPTSLGNSTKASGPVSSVPTSALPSTSPATASAGGTTRAADTSETNDAPPPVYQR